MFHCATLHHWLSFWQNSFNFTLETSHCCFIRLSVSVKKTLEVHTAVGPRDPQCDGRLSDIKSLKHFLRRHLGRWVASSTRNALRVPFIGEISTRRPMANGFRVLDMPWLIENAGRIPAGADLRFYRCNTRSIKSIISDLGKVNIVIFYSLWVLIEHVKQYFVSLSFLLLAIY